MLGLDRTGYSPRVQEKAVHAGVHSESGPYAVETWLEIYGVHAHVHADQIRNNREAWARRRA